MRMRVGWPGVAGRGSHKCSLRMAGHFFCCCSRPEPAPCFSEAPSLSHQPNTHNHTHAHTGAARAAALARGGGGAHAAGHQAGGTDVAALHAVHEGRLVLCARVVRVRVFCQRLFGPAWQCSAGAAAPWPDHWPASVQGRWAPRNAVLRPVIPCPCLLPPAKPACLPAPPPMRAGFLQASRQLRNSILQDEWTALGPLGACVLVCWHTCAGAAGSPWASHVMHIQAQEHTDAGCPSTAPPWQTAVGCCEPSP